MRTILVGVVIVGLGAAVACRGKATPPPAPAVTAAAAPSGAGEIPTYPGATRVAFSEKGPGDGYSRKVKATYLTTDALPAVRAFFERAVTEGGWTVAKFEEKPGEVKWKLWRGSSEAEVELEVKTPGSVTIGIERKDR